MKTPDERGPLGAWAYETRTLLALSDKEVVHRLGRYDAATIRKAEADGRKNMSRPLWRALTKLYVEVAREKGVTLDPMPSIGDVETPTGDMGELILAIRDQTDAINALVSRLDSLASAAIRDGVADALEEARARGGAASRGGQLLERPA